MSSAFTLKKCGVKFDPPAVVITYNVKTTGKLHRRTMPLRNFNKRSGVARVAEELKDSSRHKKYLESLPIHQLEKLIQIIQDRMNGINLQDSIQKNKAMDTIDPEEDLNVVDEKTLQRKKAIMEQAFEKHRKKPGDKDFEYDVEKDFEGGAIESCDWDSASDDEF